MSFANFKCWDFFFYKIMLLKFDREDRIGYFTHMKLQVHSKIGKFFDQ